MTELLDNRLTEFPVGFDTETTGLDFWHGCLPFFVSSWDLLKDDYEQKYWEWDVNPLTRTPAIPHRDKNAIRQFMVANRLVYHNRKIEQRGFEAIGIKLPRWDDEDTLIGSHCMRSSGSHKLKDLCLEHCDIPADDQAELKADVMECRSIGRSLGWRIARENDPHFPAMKPKSKKSKKHGGSFDEADGWWVMDMWLPRAVAKFKELPPEHRWWHTCKTYGVLDAKRTALLWLYIYEHLTTEGLVEQYVERRGLLEVTYAMENRGVSLSREEVATVKLRHGLIAEREEGKCFLLAGDKLTNIRSPKQLQEIIYTDLKLPQRRKTKTGYSTDKAQLKEFRDEARPQSRTYKFITALLKAKQHQTCLRYLASYEKFSCPIPSGHYGGQRTSDDGLRSVRATTVQPTSFLNGNTSGNSIQRSPNLQLQPGNLPHPRPGSERSLILPSGPERHRRRSNGSTIYPALDLRHLSEEDLAQYFLLHPNINITGAAATTRTSSSDPNEQNISKQEEVNLREVFCPLPGREFYSMDYSNIEMRLFAYCSGDKRLIEAFETGYKVHLIICEVLYPEQWQFCQRNGLDFSQHFESTWYQWVKNGNFALIYGAQKKKADATYHKSGAYELIRSRFPEIDNFMAKMDSTAKRLGYITTLGGYRLYVPRNRPHVACNYYIQGSAGWYLIKAMNRIHAYLKSVPDHYMTMTVHDELDFDFPQGPSGHADLSVVHRCTDIMEQSGRDLGIHVPAAVERHVKNWAHGDKLDKLNPNWRTDLCLSPILAS